MSKPDLILIGAGGHARSCIDVIEQQAKYQIAGLVCQQEQKQIQKLGYSLIATDDALGELAKSYQYALITIGHIQTAEHRLRLFQLAGQCGFKMPVIISPTAYVSRHTAIGAGSIIMHGAIVNAGARVGENCIINTRALIEHDSIVEDHCHISTGAILNGDVTVRAGSFVGSSCVIKEGVSIGNRCLIGMGLSVRHDLDDDSHFTGQYKT